jgi:CBS domain-containing protein
MDQEEAARLVSRYELLALPIIDEAGRLEGIITVDDVIDIINEESTEDMYKMAGLAEEDRVFTPISRSVRKRLPWTILNLVTASLAASVVGFFEGTLHEIVALVTFMPVIAGVGGNGATQTATVIIRAIALGELEFASAWKAIVKQVSVNLYCACGRHSDRIGRYSVERQPVSRRRARQRHDFQSRIDGGIRWRGDSALVKSAEIRSRPRRRHYRDRVDRRVWIPAVSRSRNSFPSLSG